MEVLKKDFKYVGNSPPESIKLIKEFNAKTIHMKGFDLSTLKVYHISGIVDDVVKVINCEQAFNCIEKNQFDKIEFKPMIKVQDLPDYIIEQIQNKDINTVLITPEKRWFFLAESARSLINNRAKITGRYLYEKSLIADIAFSRALKTIKDSVLAIIRQENGVKLLVSCLSDDARIIDLTSIPEYKDTSLLTFSNCVITNNLITLEFEGEAVNDFVPSIKIAWSDTGHGLMKKYLCVKTISSKRCAILKELEKEDNNKDALDYFKTIATHCYGSIESPISILSTNIKEAGKARIKKLEPDFINVRDKKKFLQLALNALDVIGEVNETTDVAVAKGVGKIFMSA